MRRTACICSMPTAFLISSLLAFAPASAQGTTATPSLRANDSLINEADSFSRAMQWRPAQRAWERVLRANPYTGRAWYQLAVASRNVADSATAIRAYVRYLEIGGAAPAERTSFGADSPGEVAYMIAGMHAGSSRPDSALVWLQRALSLGFRNRARIATDAPFVSLHDNAAFQGIVGVKRAEGRAGWRADVEYLRDEVRRLHAGRNQGARERFELAVSKLIADIPTLSQNQFTLRVQGALVQLGDGHTTFVPEAIPSWTRSVPLQYDTFADSLYIVAANPMYVDIVGARILRIGGVPVSEAIERLDAISSRDNTVTVLRNRARNLRYPQILNGLGLARSDSAVSLVVRTARGVEREVTVAAETTPASYNRFAGATGWIWVDADAQQEEPLSRRDLRAPPGAVLRHSRTRSSSTRRATAAKLRAGSLS